MRVIIVRHAQTDENVKQVDIGHDSQALLNAEGIAQAKKLGHYLKAEKITHAYVSPQQRAVHTAKEVLDHHPKATMIATDDLKEQNLGVYESVSKHVWKAVKEQSTDPFHLFKPEKGESYAELQARVSKFFRDLVRKHADDTVLIVSHGGTIGMLLLDIFQKPITKEHYQTHKPENTAVTILDIADDGKVQAHVVNSTKHLGS